MATADTAPAAAPLARTYLVDTSIYLFHAWQRPAHGQIDRQGRDCRVVSGFVAFLQKLLGYTQARRIAFAFDVSQREAFRKRLYPAYKANRRQVPADFKRQCGLCRELLTQLGMAAVSSDCYEADDVLATLARREREQGRAITVVSGDKDLVQCLRGPQDIWWDFLGQRRLNPRTAAKRFGVPPTLLAQAQALAGDKGDNIPGVPGIGLVTAGKLLKRAGSLDALLTEPALAAQVKSRNARHLVPLLEAHREQIRLACQLTQLVESVPLTPMPSVHCESPGWRALTRFMQDMGVATEAGSLVDGS